jgi:serine/threonine protein kinase
LQTPAGKRCEKIALVHQMALGMEYLHSRDIIHGDLKVSRLLQSRQVWY